MAALTNDQILDAIASMSVLEASELVKAMEEKFGVTAAVAVAAAPGAAAGAAAEDEQTEFTVTLDSFDAAKKIGVIKAVKTLTNLGLGEAKALVEGAPATVKEGLSKADADKWIADIDAAGGKASKILVMSYFINFYEAATEN